MEEDRLSDAFARNGQGRNSRRNQVPLSFRQSSASAGTSQDSDPQQNVKQEAPANNTKSSKMELLDKVTDVDVQEAVKKLVQSVGEQQYSGRGERSLSPVGRRFYNWNTTHFYPDVHKVDIGILFQRGSKPQNQQEPQKEEDDSLEESRECSQSSSSSENVASTERDMKRNETNGSQGKALDVKIDFDLDSYSESEDDIRKSWHKSPLHVRRIRRRDGRPLSAEVNYDSSSKKLYIHTISKNTEEESKPSSEPTKNRKLFRRLSAPGLAKSNETASSCNKSRIASEATSTNMIRQDVDAKNRPFRPPSSFADQAQKRRQFIRQLGKERGLDFYEEQDLRRGIPYERARHSQEDIQFIDESMAEFEQNKNRSITLKTRGNYYGFEMNQNKNSHDRQGGFENTQFIPYMNAAQHDSRHQNVEEKSNKSEVQFRNLNNQDKSAKVHKLTSSFENIYDDVDLSSSLTMSDKIELFEKQAGHQTDKFSQSFRNENSKETPNELNCKENVPSQSKKSEKFVREPLRMSLDAKLDSVKNNFASSKIDSSENNRRPGAKEVFKKPIMDAKTLMEEEKQKFQEYKISYRRQHSGPESTSGPSGDEKEVRKEHQETSQSRKAIPPDDYVYILRKIHQPNELASKSSSQLPVISSNKTYETGVHLKKDRPKHSKQESKCSVPNQVDQHSDSREFRRGLKQLYCNTDSSPVQNKSAFSEPKVRNFRELSGDMQNRDHNTELRLNVDPSFPSRKTGSSKPDLIPSPRFEEGSIPTFKPTMMADVSKASDMAPLPLIVYNNKTGKSERLFVTHDNSRDNLTSYNSSGLGHSRSDSGHAKQQSSSARDAMPGRDIPSNQTLPVHLVSSYPRPGNAIPGSAFRDYNAHTRIEQDIQATNTGPSTKFPSAVPVGYQPAHEQKPPKPRREEYYSSDPKDWLYNTSYLSRMPGFNDDEYVRLMGTEQTPGGYKQPINLGITGSSSDCTDLETLLPLLPRRRQQYRLSIQEPDSHVIENMSTESTSLFYKQSVEGKLKIPICTANQQTASLSKKPENVCPPKAMTYLTDDVLNKSSVLNRDGDMSRDYNDTMVFSLTGYHKKPSNSNIYENSDFVDQMHYRGASDTFPDDKVRFHHPSLPNSDCSRPTQWTSMERRRPLCWTDSDKRRPIIDWPDLEAEFGYPGKSDNLEASEYRQGRGRFTQEYSDDVMLQKSSYENEIDQNIRNQNMYNTEFSRNRPDLNTYNQINSNQPDHNLYNNEFIPNRSDLGSYNYELHQNRPDLNMYNIWQTRAHEDPYYYGYQTEGARVPRQGYEDLHSPCDSSKQDYEYNRRATENIPTMKSVCMVDNRLTHDWFMDQEELPHPPRPSSRVPTVEPELPYIPPNLTFLCDSGKSTLDQRTALNRRNGDLPGKFITDDEVPGKSRMDQRSMEMSSQSRMDQRSMEMSSQSMMDQRSFELSSQSMMDQRSFELPSQLRMDQRSFELSSQSRMDQRSFEVSSQSSINQRSLEVSSQSRMDQRSTEVPSKSRVDHKDPGMKKIASKRALDFQDKQMDPFENQLKSVLEGKLRQQQKMKNKSDQNEEQASKATSDYERHVNKSQKVFKELKSAKLEPSKSDETPAREQKQNGESRANVGKPGKEPREKSALELHLGTTSSKRTDRVHNVKSSPSQVRDPYTIQVGINPTFNENRPALDVSVSLSGSREKIQQQDEDDLPQISVAAIKEKLFGSNEQHAGMLLSGLNLPTLVAQKPEESKPPTRSHSMSDRPPIKKTNAESVERLHSYVSYKDGQQKKKSMINDALTDLERTYEGLVSSEEEENRVVLKQIPDQSFSEPVVKRLSITNLKMLTDSNQKDPSLEYTERWLQGGNSYVQNYNTSDDGQVSFATDNMQYSSSLQEKPNANAYQNTTAKFQNTVDCSSPSDSLCNLPRKVFDDMAYRKFRTGQVPAKSDPDLPEQLVNEMNRRVGSDGNKMASDANELGKTSSGQISSYVAKPPEPGRSSTTRQRKELGEPIRHLSRSNSIGVTHTSAKEIKLERRPSLSTGIAKLVTMFEKSQSAPNLAEASVFGDCYTSSGELVSEDPKYAKYALKVKKQQKTPKEMKLRRERKSRMKLLKTSADSGYVESETDSHSSSGTELVTERIEPDIHATEARQESTLRKKNETNETPEERAARLKKMREEWFQNEEMVDVNKSNSRFFLKKFPHDNSKHQSDKSIAAFDILPKSSPSLPLTSKSMVDKTSNFSSSDQNLSSTSNTKSGIQKTTLNLSLSPPTSSLPPFNRESGNNLPKAFTSSKDGEVDLKKTDLGYTPRNQSNENLSKNNKQDSKSTDWHEAISERVDRETKQNFDGDALITETTTEKMKSKPHQFMASKSFGRTVENPSKKSLEFESKSFQQENQTINVDGGRSTKQQVQTRIERVFTVEKKSSSVKSSENIIPDLRRDPTIDKKSMSYAEKLLDFSDGEMTDATDVTLDTILGPNQLRPFSPENCDFSDMEFTALTSCFTTRSSEHRTSYNANVKTQGSSEASSSSTSASGIRSIPVQVLPSQEQLISEAKAEMKLYRKQQPGEGKELERKRSIKELVDSFEGMSSPFMRTRPRSMEIQLDKEDSK